MRTRRFTRTFSDDHYSCRRKMHCAAYLFVSQGVRKDLGRVFLPSFSLPSLSLVIYMSMAFLVSIVWCRGVCASISTLRPASGTPSNS